MCRGRALQGPEGKVGDGARGRRSRSPGGRRAMTLVPSIAFTRGSVRSRQSSWPSPTSTAWTSDAPCCRRQSVKPPVEQPASIQTLPLHSRLPRHRGPRPSFSPPRETKAGSSRTLDRRVATPRACPASRPCCRPPSTSPAQDPGAQLLLVAFGEECLQQLDERDLPRWPSHTVESWRILSIFTAFPLDRSISRSTPWISARGVLHLHLQRHLREAAGDGRFLLHPDDAVHGPGHADVGDVGGAPRQDPLVGGLHVRVRADDRGDLAVEVTARGPPSPPQTSAWKSTITALTRERNCFRSALPTWMGSRSGDRFTRPSRLMTRTAVSRTVTMQCPLPGIAPGPGITG